MYLVGVPTCSWKNAFILPVYISIRFNLILFPPGLHDKLSEKYLQNGRVIPPAPDKSMLGMTKIKMGKETVEDAAGMPDEVS